MNIPRPKTTFAYLYCTALHRFTAHKYYDTQECTVPRTAGPSGEALGGPGWEHLFECVESKTRRRWGVEDRVAVVCKEAN